MQKAGNFANETVRQIQEYCSLFVMLGNVRNMKIQGSLFCNIRKCKEYEKRKKLRKVSTLYFSFLIRNV